ncbi:hypothetical protein F4823DRAFT_159729 [Ustulina deusta]|nr:hypothetical protein F4823DRAFT_159729 [Ustulina deusta]
MRCRFRLVWLVYKRLSMAKLMSILLGCAGFTHLKNAYGRRFSVSIFSRNAEPATIIYARKCQDSLSLHIRAR